MKTYDELTEIKTGFLQRYPVKRRSVIANFFSNAIARNARWFAPGPPLSNTPIEVPVDEITLDWALDAVVNHLCNEKEKVLRYINLYDSYVQTHKDIGGLLKSASTESDTFVDVVDWYRLRYLEKYRAITFKPKSSEVPPTEKQVNFLRSLGCWDKPQSTLHASQLIGELVSPR